MDWISYKELGSGQYHMVGGGRRSALLRMDRWATERDRRSRLCDPFHAAQARQHLERCACQTHRGTPRPRTHAPRPPRGVRETCEDANWNLFIRATQSGGAYGDATAGTTCA